MPCLCFHPFIHYCYTAPRIFPLHKNILRELHLKSHHLAVLTGLYTTLNCIKYFIVTCTVIDTELWLCLDKSFIQCLMPGYLFSVVQIHSIYSDLFHCVSFMYHGYTVLWTCLGLIDSKFIVRIKIGCLFDFSTSMLSLKLVFVESVDNWMNYTQKQILTPADTSYV